MIATPPARRRRERITDSEAIQGGHDIIVYAVDKPATSSMRSPFPPPWAWQADPELGLLRAFVAIVEAHAAARIRSVPCPDCGGARCADCWLTGQVAHPEDARAMTAEYASVLSRLEAREQGRLSAADRKRDGQPVYRMSDELRAIFGQADPIRALIGAKGDHFVPGLAQLTESELEAFWLHLHGMSRSGIALALVPLRRRRFGREAAVPLATVSAYLTRARRKVRLVFALPLEDEASYLAALDAEEASAEQQRRLVDASRVRAEELARTGPVADPTQAWPAPWEEDLAPPGYEPVEDEDNPDPYADPFAP